MTIQRHYTLPNCNLKLEGLAPGDDTDPMAPMTVVLNSECAFPGVSETLSGGREFLNSLIKTVGDYAQSMLSGVPYPLAGEASDSYPVTLRPSEHHRHHLVAMVTDADGSTTHKTLELNSVQLFDLMEAIDQLLADTQTLPDMVLQLSPLHRRHARPAEPASKRVFPATAGLSALAASAALLFMVPVPEFEPQRTNEGRSLSELVEEETANLAESAATPRGDSSDIDATDDAMVEGNNEDLVGGTVSEREGAANEPVDPVAAGIALGRLSSAPAIRDTGTLNDLETDLEMILEDNLAEDLTFDEALVYRVAVSETGDILGYKYENEAALENADSTPLPDLTFIPLESEDASDEPIAQFLVTFEPDGDVIANPLEDDDEE